MFNKILPKVTDFSFRTCYALPGNCDYDLEKLKEEYPLGSIAYTEEEVVEHNFYENPRSEIRKNIGKIINHSTNPVVAIEIELIEGWLVDYPFYNHGTAWHVVNVETDRIINLEELETHGRS